MPILGATATSTAAGISKRGAYIPQGSLSNWLPARDAVKAGTATNPVEIRCFGDSTTYGAAAGGVYGAAIYSWVERLRADAIGAGYTDGGFGMVNANDSYTGYSANTQGDAPTFSASVASAWTNVPDGMGQTGFKSITPGDTCTVTIKNCRYARFYYTSGVTSGKISYAFDGGTTTTVDAWRTGTQPYDVKVVWKDFGSIGTHTVTVTNAGASTINTGSTTTGAEFAVEAITGPGLVFHRDAISGASASAFFQSVSAFQKTQTPWSHLRVGLTSYLDGTVNTYPWGAAVGAKPTYSNAKAAIFQIGTNDIGANVTADNNLTDQTSYGVINRYIESLNHFIRACRAANCDPIIASPPFDVSVDPGASTFAGRVKALTFALCQATGTVYVDFGEVVGPVNTHVAKLYGGGNIAGPHLGVAAYQAEADFIWNNVLGI